LCPSLHHLHVQCLLILEALWEMAVISMVWFSFLLADVSKCHRFCNTWQSCGHVIVLLNPNRHANPPSFKDAIPRRCAIELRFKRGAAV